MALTPVMHFPAYYPANATHSPLVRGATSTVTGSTTTPCAVQHHHTLTQVDSCYGSNPHPFKHRTISKTVSVSQEYHPRTLLAIDHNYSFHRCHVKPLQPLNNSGHGVPSQSQSQLRSHLSTATSRGHPGPCLVRGTRPVSSALPSTTPQHSRLADYHSTYGFPNPPRHTPLTFPWHNFRNKRVIPPKHQDL